MVYANNLDLFLLHYSKRTNIIYRLTLAFIYHGRVGSSQVIPLANGVRRLVEHQTDSYEDFVRNKLPLIIQSTPPITVWHEQHPELKKYKYEFKLSFEKVTYMKPRIQEATGRVKPMLPMEARVLQLHLCCADVC